MGNYQEGNYSRDRISRSSMSRSKSSPDPRGFVSVVPATYLDSISGEGDSSFGFSDFI